MKTLEEYMNESLVKSYDTIKLKEKIYKKYQNIMFEDYDSKSKENVFIIHFNLNSDYEAF